MFVPLCNLLLVRPKFLKDSIKDTVFMYLKSTDNKSANIPGEFFVRKFPCVFTLLTSEHILNSASPSELFLL
jgi:hypothetical protein